MHVKKLLPIFAAVTFIATASMTLTSFAAGKSLPVLTRDGYTFEGWYDNKEGKGEKITDSTLVTESSAKKLYAKWKVKTYKIVLDPNGGKIDPVSFDLNFDQTYAEQHIDRRKPTKEGHIFKGWYNNKDCSGSQFASSTVCTETSPKTLFAKWEAEQYTITLDPNGGSLSSSLRTFPATYGKTYTGLSGRTPTLPGHVFVGWYKDRQGTGDKITTDTLVTVTSPRTLYARLDPKTYTVTLHPGVGNLSTRTIPTEYGEKYSELKDKVPTADGWEFEGWYANSQCTGSKITENTLVTETSPRNLYAKMVPKTYTITLNPNGGTLSTRSINVTYKGTYSALAGKTPTREEDGDSYGYTTNQYQFVGWQDSNGNIVTKDSILNTPRDMVLTAKWQKRTRNIHYVAGSSHAPSSIHVSWERVNGLGDVGESSSFDISLNGSTNSGGHNPCYWTYTADGTNGKLSINNTSRSFTFRITVNNNDSLYDSVAHGSTGSITVPGTTTPEEKWPEGWGEWTDM